jgi:hypothetical protein
MCTEIVNCAWGEFDSYVLKCCIVRGVIFDRCVLKFCTLRVIRFDVCVLKLCILRRVNFDKCVLNLCIWRGVKILKMRTEILYCAFFMVWHILYYNCVLCNW